jgi:hypothetical protein
MALGISVEFVGSNILDAPGVDDARRDVTGVHEVLQPRGAVGIDFVVIGGHAVSLVQNRTKADSTNPSGSA